MKAAGKEEFSNRGRSRSPGLKGQDESYGTSVAERASRGVALVVSGCEMPSRRSASVDGDFIASHEPLNCQCS